MKTVSFIISIILFMAVNSFAQIKFEPPKTPIRPVTDELHKFKITDNYRWLEDKDNAEVKEWSHKQTDYTIEYINKTCPEIPGIKDEIRNYIDRDNVGAPFFKKDREFFYKKLKGEQQSKIYTRIKGKEKLIFDPLVIDPSGKTSVSGFALNADASKAAVGTQFKGDEINIYQIIDTKTGKTIGEPMKNIYSFSWCRDEKFAYVTLRSREDIDKQLQIGRAHV